MSKKGRVRGWKAIVKRLLNQRDGRLEDLSYDFLVLIILQ